MNYWQILQQIRYLLRQQKWTGSSTVVFENDSVQIVAGDSDLEILEARLILPAAIIIPGAGQSDQEGGGDQPDLISRQLSVLVITKNEGDKLGMGAIIGANREGLTDSRGRGVLEIEREVFNAIEKLTAEAGIVISHRATGEPDTRRDQDDNAYALQAYDFEAFCSADPFYMPGRRLTAAIRTGEVTLSWGNPATRYDTYRPRLTRKAGSVAPTSPTDGTELILAAGMPVSKVDSALASGTYSYSLFISYDDFSATPVTDLQTSDPVSVTGVVVS